ncbi:MAG TPA: DUF1501 domain-containing protein [Planctomycetaceae bacterium]|nr:DUF1501 domain-containing protein [Planctomycetaceae bacterium]
MSTNRREFLKLLGTAGVVSLAGPVPALWSQAIGAETKAPGERVLVLIQLAGGNDGLNTVVPINDDSYYKARPGIAIGKGAALKLNDAVGLHPSMTGFRDLWDTNRLAIVQGVGYPKPDRSHFRSMDIWHAAHFSERIPNGWIGRLLDQTVSSSSTAWEAACIGLDKLPLACLGERVVPPTIQRLEEFRLTHSGRDVAVVSSPAWKQVAASASGSGELDFLRRSATAAVTSAERLASLSQEYRSTAAYPSTALAQRLKLVAQMITADLPARVYFVSLDGFDTHAQQLPGHAVLLSELSSAIAAFFADLDEKNHGNRVMLATFSEFGRRLAENGSLGTDHGAASVQFVVTPPGKGGMYGTAPSLTDLDDGDPKFTTDFRRVYATLLERWLQRPSEPILGEVFAPLDFA